MLKKMEQAKKKAEAVVNTVDISEREKMAQLKRCELRSGARKLPEAIYWYSYNFVLFLVSTRKQA